MNQTAHISLQILSISKSVETKATGCALTFWRAPPVLSLFSFCVSLPAVSSVARLAPRWCITAPPVKGCLRRVAKTRKPFFHETRSFLQKSVLSSKNNELCADYFILCGSAAIKLPCKGPIPPQILGLVRLKPQERAGATPTHSYYPGP